MPLKGLHVGSETAGRKTPQRARLSDITNTAPLILSKHQEDDHGLKACEGLLHKELANLRKTVAEKEQLIQAQKVNMEKLWTNYTKKTKQNEDIIEQNGRLYKELMQTRDKLKVLQHENNQMASVHKVIKTELQAKLAKALEQVDLSLKTTVLVGSEKGPEEKQANIPNVLAKLAESRARRTVNLCEAPNELFGLVKQDSAEQSATCRSTLRRRPSLSYKEPSLKVKLRQKETKSNRVKSCLNRRESQFHQLHKVCEEEPSIAGAMPCRSEILHPPCSQAAMQSQSSRSLNAMPDNVSDGRQNSASSFLNEEITIGVGLKSSEELQRQMLDSPSLDEPPSGRPCRRSAAGSVISYKEASLNTKLRRV